MPSIYNELDMKVGEVATNELDKAQILLEIGRHRDGILKLQDMSKKARDVFVRWEQEVAVMGAVKNEADLIECHYCGQLVMFEGCTSIPLADSPDDFYEVAVCDQCADDYAEMVKDDPEEEEICYEENIKGDPS